MKNPTAFHFSVKLIYKITGAFSAVRVRSSGTTQR